MHLYCLFRIIQSKQAYWKDTWFTNGTLHLHKRIPLQD